MTTPVRHLQSSEDLSHLPLGLLLGRISGLLRSRLLAICQDSGDDVRLIGLVLAIARNSGATQADYARFLGIDLNTASRLVNRAEERGLVRRVPSKEDRRAFSLELTDEGKRTVKTGSRAVESIESELKDHLGAAEFAAFRKTAERLLAQLARD